MWLCCMRHCSAGSSPLGNCTWAQACARATVGAGAAAAAACAERDHTAPGRIQRAAHRQSSIYTVHTTLTATTSADRQIYRRVLRERCVLQPRVEHCSQILMKIGTDTCISASVGWVGVAQQSERARLRAAMLLRQAALSAQHCKAICACSSYRSQPFTPRNHLQRPGADGA